MSKSEISGSRLYVGNLPYSYRSDDLYKLFSEFGVVTDAVVMMESGLQERSKGFGFVTMANKVDAEKAASVMNNKDLLGRPLVCNIAKPREPRFAF